jgi:hypothetical protein
MKWLNAHLSIALPEEEYSEIRKHPEIKWGQIARRALMEHVRHLKDYDEFVKSKESKQTQSI